ncbi:MAG: hypothetical protein HY269_00360, partial [Deltaproteobacteria bacterium]|nr:hypothetical protein [Deltaproteobacteria bacterium]
HFQAVAPGVQTKDYDVTADVTLFQKYRVGIQEGPALCARALLADLAMPHTKHTPLILAEKEILAHVASRAVPPRKPFRRRPRVVRPAFEHPASTT